jgi:hypothetical protein
MFVQRGAPSDKQEAALLGFILSRHMAFMHLVPHWRPQDAVTLVLSGTVTAIVAAFNSRAVQKLAADIGDAGEVIVIRPEPMVVEPPKRKLGTLGDLIVRWRRAGKSVRDIAVDIGSETTDIRAVLRKAGEDPD